MKVGYQGDIGSNNEDAAYKLIKNSFPINAQSGIVEYIPLISSERVLNGLVNGDIDYGVCATRSYTENNIIRVNETKLALKDTSRLLEVLDVIQLPIHHCLFKLPDTKIDTIASHEQALLRTIRNRKKLFPMCKEVKEKDTAWCARALRSGELPKNYGIICKKETGEKYNLELIAENIEDEPIRTEFVLYKKCAEE